MEWGVVVAKIAAPPIYRRLACGKAQIARAETELISPAPQAVAPASFVWKQVRGLALRRTAARI